MAEFFVVFVEMRFVVETYEIAVFTRSSNDLFQITSISENDSHFSPHVIYRYVLVELGVNEVSVNRERTHDGGGNSDPTFYFHYPPAYDKNSSTEWKSLSSINFSISPRASVTSFSK